MSLCHIGLVKDHGGHLVDQPRLSLVEKCWKTTFGDKISTLRKTNKTEHGEVNLQMKEHALSMQRSGTNLIEKIW